MESQTQPPRRSYVAYKKYIRKRYIKDFPPFERQRVQKMMMSVLARQTFQNLVTVYESLVLTECDFVDQLEREVIESLICQPKRIRKLKKD